MREYGLPQDKLFFKLSEIKSIGLMSTERAKKELYRGKLHGIKNGRDWLIPREELVRYMNEEMNAGAVVFSIPRTGAIRVLYED